MSGWLEAYERLPEAAQARVRRWIHLQKLIAETLRIPFDTWIETYVGGAMAAPFDYGFMEVATVSGFTGLDVDGATFTRELDPATARTARIPVRARNQLGRLSPGLQDAIAAILEPDGDGREARVPPADVATLQKIFPGEAPLARLKRPDFRRVRIRRSGSDVEVGLEGGAEPLLRLDLLAFSAVLNQPRL